MMVFGKNPAPQPGSIVMQLTAQGQSQFQCQCRCVKDNAGCRMQDAGCRMLDAGIAVGKKANRISE